MTINVVASNVFNNDYGLYFPRINYTASLAATTNTQLTVPGDFPNYVVIINLKRTATTNVYFSVNHTAASAAGSSFAASNSILLSDGLKYIFRVNAGDVLNFYSLIASTDVSVSFYSPY